MTPTPDPALAARFAELKMDAHNGSIPEAMKLTHAIRDAYRSGQLITLADHEAAMQAAVAKAVEACAEIADAYADENIRMAGDSVLFDPVLSRKRGDILTRGDLIKSEELILDGAIHSAMFHAAQNIAAAIRASKGDAL